MDVIAPAAYSHSHMADHDEQQEDAGRDTSDSEAKAFDRGANALIRRLLRFQALRSAMPSRIKISALLGNPESKVELQKAAFAAKRRPTATASLTRVLPLLC